MKEPVGLLHGRQAVRSLSTFEVLRVEAGLLPINDATDLVVPIVLFLHHDVCCASVPMNKRHAWCLKLRCHVAQKSQVSRRPESRFCSLEVSKGSTIIVRRINVPLLGVVIFATAAVDISQRLTLWTGQGSKALEQLFQLGTDGTLLCVRQIWPCLLEGDTRHQRHEKVVAASTGQETRKFWGADFLLGTVKWSFRS